MKRRKIYLKMALFLTFIGIVNIYPINIYFSLLVGDRSLKSSDYHFSGRIPNGFSVWLGDDGMSKVEREFDKYSKVYPNDSILHRNFAINPFKFWRWSEYMFSDLYKYPYKKISNEWHNNEWGVALDSSIVNP